MLSSDNLEEVFKRMAATPAEETTSATPARRRRNPSIAFDPHLGKGRNVAKELDSGATDSLFESYDINASKSHPSFT